MKKEKRLIDANAMDALEKLDYDYAPVRDGCAWYRAADVWACIESQPTVDAVEVVHGYWGTDRFGLDRSICSVCGACYEGDGGNYCRNCGAKMDGG